MTLTIGQRIHYLLGAIILAAGFASPELRGAGNGFFYELGFSRFMGFRNPFRVGQSLPTRSSSGRVLLVLLGLICTFQIGCTASREFAVNRAADLVKLGTRSVVQVRPVRQSKRNSLTRWLVRSPDAPSERTAQLLRRYDRKRQYDEDPDGVIEWLEELAQNRPVMEQIHALAEIAEIQADFSAQNGDLQRAKRLYATAVIHAYQFLFDPKLDLARNAYDPQFRSICDVYNRSLEELLRDVFNNGELRANQTIRVGNEQQGIEFEVRLEGRWQDQEFERFELVNDYEASGIDNRYHRYGLGIPLIAIRKQQPVNQAHEKYYPPDLTMPMTAFVHMLPDTTSSIPGRSSSFHRALLTLYDPLEKSQVQAGSTVVPLESDFTTPLAYALKDPFLNKGVLAAASLIDSEYVPESYGFFMLEPFDPDKIPVVMAHGLWSTPVIWVHMFNDLRANREIRENYQFWFYSYPTGQPFWISAQQMRRDLAEVRQTLDPGGRSQSLNQMILVGHSMGGLISLLQTFESKNHFWSTISDEPIESLKGDPASIQALRSTFFFHPNPDIDRVITIATPLRGSQFANPAIRWLGQRLIKLPDIATQDFQEIARRNKGKIKNSTLGTTTSVDSLAPNNPVFDAIAVSEQLKGVHTNNIVGRVPKKFVFKTSSQSDRSSGDGVVTVASAINEAAQTQVFVPEEHTKLPQHPGCIYEVRRILLENLVDIGRVRGQALPRNHDIQNATLLEPLTDRSIPTEFGKE